MTSIVLGVDGLPRCSWSQTAPEFPHYHDTEWGFPVTDDRALFEKLCLESFQAGLSWRTILVKRESFRAAFSDFDFYRVAKFQQDDVERLLSDASIVRNRKKIQAVINNASRAIEMVEQEGSLSTFLWRYQPNPALAAAPQTVTTCAESIALAKELKKRGWQFVGPTTAFAFMQAMGLLNDHLVGCFIRDKIQHSKK